MHSAAQAKHAITWWLKELFVTIAFCVNNPDSIPPRLNNLLLVRLKLKVIAASASRDGLRIVHLLARGNSRPGLTVAAGAGASALDSKLGPLSVALSVRRLQALNGEHCRPACRKGDTAQLGFLAPHSLQQVLAPQGNSRRSSRHCRQAPLQVRETVQHGASRRRLLWPGARHLKLGFDPVVMAFSSLRNCRHMPCDGHPKAVACLA